MFDEVFIVDFEVFVIDVCVNFGGVDFYGFVIVECFIVM